MVCFLASGVPDPHLVNLRSGVRITVGEAESVSESVSKGCVMGSGIKSGSDLLLDLHQVFVYHNQVTVDFEI